MAADIVLKRHDQMPTIQGVCKQGGLPLDLTGAAQVNFIMAPVVNGVTGTPKVNAAAVVVSAASGVVRYDWSPADTDTAGEFWASFEVIWTLGSKPQTFPGDGYITVEIQPDLDNV